MVIATAPRGSGRPSRPGRPSSGRPSAGRPSSGQPSAGRPGSARSGSARSGDGKTGAGSSGARKGGGRTSAFGAGDRTSRDRRPSDDGARRRVPAQDRAGAESRPRHDDPPIPEDVRANELPREARADLKTLSKDNGEEVARHLVMVARLIDADPALAHRHALAASRRAGRVGVVRETTAITAYAIGDFALALRELRTYRRITGRDDQLPLMVDAERGVGRPKEALELGRSVPRASLDPAVQVSLAIAMSGARLDLGQLELALAELEIPQLDPDTAFSYSPALFDAYATVLQDLGRTADAERWYHLSERATAALASASAGSDTIEIIEEELELAEETVEVDSSDSDEAGSAQ